MDDGLKERIIKEIKQEDLTGFSPATTQVLQALGPEAFARLCEVCGGVSAYFPKLESVMAAARDRMLIKEANGYNYTELAMKYGISEVWVRQVVGKARMKQDSISLFEEELTGS